MPPVKIEEIEIDARDSYDQRTALMWASCQGLSDIANLLLLKGATLLLRDANLHSAIDLALHYEKTASMCVLLPEIFFGYRHGENIEQEPKLRKAKPMVAFDLAIEIASAAMHFASIKRVIHPELADRFEEMSGRAQMTASAMLSCLQAKDHRVSTLIRIHRNPQAQILVEE